MPLGPVLRSILGSALSPALGEGGGWWLHGSALDLDFARSRGYNSTALSSLTPDSILTYTAPSPKLVYGSDGVLGYAPHNLFLNSGAPATQDVTLITGFSYTVTVTGGGSLAGSSGASGTASAGSPATFVATGTTGTFTLTGSLTTIQINRAPAHSGYIPTTAAAVYSLPIDHDPVTLAPLGVLIEEQRTNGIRNNAMVGASASPSTFPTNWTEGNGSGLTRTVVGVGVENGIAYIDVRVNGTTTATSGYQLNYDAATGVSALTGEAWTGSTFLALVGGSIANLTSIFACDIAERTGAGTFVASKSGADIKGSLTAGLTRFINSATLSGGGTVANVQPRLNFTAALSAVLDITVRIGLPQCERGAFATSPILTSGSQVTRAADQVSILTSAFGYNAAAGTVVCEFTADAVGAAYVLSSLDDGTASNRMDSRASTTRHLDVIVAGVTQAQIDAGTISANVATKLATAYQLDNFAACINGGSVGTDTVGTVPTVTTFRIGRNFDGAGQFAGHIKRLTYFPTRRSNADLQVLST